MSDENTYVPSTYIHYQRSMEDFEDKVRFFSTKMENFNLKKLLPKTYKPANFYILPKVHKTFETFPPGRPISSTRGCINQGISMLLDKILQPLCKFLPEVIFDTGHLIYLLSRLTLDPKKKYILLVADINSMYTEFPVQKCKNACIELFNQYYDHLDSKLISSSNQLNKLLHLALDFSFLKFSNDFFIQKKGIQMGNCSSVSIANLTAHIELLNIWKPEMIFKARFIDDIFSIIDTTGIHDFNNWISNTFVHDYLTFSVEFHTNTVHFLDINISLKEDNMIVTNLYSKPINKHQYLHFNSNHTNNLLKNLPYSAGLRVIRNCSESTDANDALHKMFNSFKKRGYSPKLLSETMLKLSLINRESLIKPYQKRVISHIRFNYPDLINDNINISTEKCRVDPYIIYITLPFYKSLSNLSKILIEHIYVLCHQSNQPDIRLITRKLKIKSAFILPNNIYRAIS